MGPHYTYSMMGLDRVGLTIWGPLTNIKWGPQPPHHVAHWQCLAHWQCPTRWGGCPHPLVFVWWSKAIPEGQKAAKDFCRRDNEPIATTKASTVLQKKIFGVMPHQKYRGAEWRAQKAGVGWGMGKNVPSPAD